MSLFRTALILGLLSAVGPFAIDMYLPAMPAIAAGLGADVATIQLTLIAYFVAFGVAQLFYGPWADQSAASCRSLSGQACFCWLRLAVRSPHRSNGLWRSVHCKGWVARF